MNLPNAVALFLVVLALNFMLLLVVLPTTELIGPAMDSVAVVGQLLPIEKPTFYDGLFAGLIWLLETSLWVIFGAPAILLTLVAFGIWILVGRSRLLKARQEASLEEERELVLQDFLTGVIGRLGGSAEVRSEAPWFDLLKLQLRLDARRLHRVAAFFRRAGFGGGDAAGSLAATTPPHLIYSKSANLASVVALVFFLLAGFCLFWGSMTGAFAVPFSKLGTALSGLSLDARFGLLAMALLWGLSISPAAFGIGFWRMGRLDRDLAARWQEARSKVGTILYQGFRKQVAILLARKFESAVEQEQASRVITALASVTLPELEAADRQACLDLLQARGLEAYEPFDHEPGRASAASLDVVGIEPQGAPV